MLNRGSAADYDSWESLGNPGWGWEGLYPYFVKVSPAARPPICPRDGGPSKLRKLTSFRLKHSSLDAPSDAAVEEFGITWGEESFGDGPIHQSFSSFQFPGISMSWPRKLLLNHESDMRPPQKSSATPSLKPVLKPPRTLLVRALPTPFSSSPTSNDKLTCVSRRTSSSSTLTSPSNPVLTQRQGDAYGVIWYPTALDNSTATRSYAVNGYWEPAAERPNLHLLTGDRVNRVLFDEDRRAESVVIKERGNEDAKQMRVQATREIVVSAGAIHSPQVLQRSGIGPRALLEEAGLDVVEDLPGVGSNLQDHAVTSVSWRCKCSDPDFSLRGGGKMKTGT